MSLRERSERQGERVRVDCPGAASPLHHSTLIRRCAPPSPKGRRIRWDESIVGFRRKCPAFPTPSSFPKLYSWRRARRPYHAVHPVGGEGVGSTFLDVGGLWSSDEARGRLRRGSLRTSMDGVRLLAARFLCGTSAALDVSARLPPSGTARNRPGVGKAQTGPAAGTRVENDDAGRLSRRNGKTHKHRASPVAPRPPQPLAALRQSASTHA